MHRLFEISLSFLWGHFLLLLLIMGAKSVISSLYICEARETIFCGRLPLWDEKRHSIQSILTCLHAHTHTRTRAA